MKKIILLFCILSVYHVVKGQSGIPDPAFGSNGAIITTPATTGSFAFSYATQCQIQADGKICMILQAGNKAKITRRLSDGTIDASYGNNGYSVVTSMSVYASALQTDGKIVVAGTDGISDFLLARYNTDGTLDVSFGNGGVMITDIGSSNDFLDALVITDDGKIIAGGSTTLNGYNQFVLVEYTSAGIIDAAFGNNGIVITDFNNVYSTLSSLALQPDGKIVAVGVVGTNNGDFALARYNPDGSPDLFFNATGQATSDFGANDGARSVVISSDGKIYAGGESADLSGNTHFRIARYNLDGSPDISFNSGSGSVLVAFGTSYDFLTNIRLQNDGKVIASGRTTLNPASQDIELIRVNTDGTIDNNFGTNGNGLVLADINSGIDESAFLVIQQDGKIVAGGFNVSFTNTPSYTFSCFRFNTDGTPDAGFGTGGSFNDFVRGAYYSYNGVFLQGDGKLLTESYLYDGTTATSFINRFNANGTPDVTYGQNGTFTLPSASGGGYFQPDGKLLHLDYSNTNNGDIMLLRYNPDGTPDANFGNGGVVISDFGGNEAASVAAFQADGKIVIGGFTRDNSGTDWLIVRYNTDGSVDRSFGTNGYVITNIEIEDNIQAITIAPDGKILLGGTGYIYPPDFSFFHSDVLLAILNTDGSFDATFGQQGKLIIDKSPNDFMGALQVQNDDKIIFTRYETTAGTNQSILIQRLNADGSTDNTFGQNGSIPCDGASILLQNDQKILILGGKINNQNNTDISLARLNTDGIPDLSFGTNGKTISSFTGVDNFLYTPLISGNNLFATGNGVDKTGMFVGLIAKYQLDPLNGISCPADQIVNTDANLCSAKVYGIDPVSTSANVTYTLTGATTANGSGSASGLVFNKGITTVTYTLSSDATKSCSFTVTVPDKQPPVIENLTASPSALWPPDHKLKTITLSYAAHDNCGIASTQVTVTSNDPAQSGENGDLSPDWEIADARHVRLRAEKLKSGKERIYTIKVTVTDAAGNQTFATVNVTVPKSNGNASPNLIVSATPNPSSNYFVITIHSNSNDKINGRLLDDNGIIINTISNVSAPQTFKIGEKLRAGIYFLQVTQSGITQTIKLIKQ